MQLITMYCVCVCVYGGVGVVGVMCMVTSAPHLQAGKLGYRDCVAHIRSCTHVLLCGHSWQLLSLGHQHNKVATQT